MKPSENRRRLALDRAKPTTRGTSGFSKMGTKNPHGNQHTKQEPQPVRPEPTPSGRRARPRTHARRHLPIQKNI